MGDDASIIPDGPPAIAREAVREPSALFLQPSGDRGPNAGGRLLCAVRQRPLRSPDPPPETILPSGGHWPAVLSLLQPRWIARDAPNRCLGCAPDPSPRLPFHRVRRSPGSFQRPS